jgi:PhnB protein
MATRLTPYLNFPEGTRAAMEYYRSVFGGELTVSTFGETPGMGLPESENDKVMHSMLEVGSDMTLMAADVPPGMDASPNGTLTLSGDDEDKLRGWWDALSSDGTVGVPLEKAPWGDSFGMCVDRFGVAWMVNITGS